MKNEKNKPSSSFYFRKLSGQALYLRNLMGFSSLVTSVYWGYQTWMQHKQNNQEYQESTVDPKVILTPKDMEFYKDQYPEATDNDIKRMAYDTAKINGERVKREYDARYFRDN